MKLIYISIMVFLLTSCSVFGIRTTEEAKFTVLLEQDDIEIRQYEEYLLAETLVEGGYDKSSSIGFRRLFDYISGKNKSKQNIEMTASVIQEENEEIEMTAPVFQEENQGKWVMAFMMPSKYTLKTIPEPIDPKVSIKKVEAKKVAVLNYSGSLSGESIQENTKKLVDWLKKNNYTLLSLPRSAGYDPPFTIPFLRRNEIHIDVE